MWLLQLLLAREARAQVALEVSVDDGQGGVEISHLFAPRFSSTSQIEDEDFRIAFRDGSKLSGDFAHDTVQLQEWRADGVRFGLSYDGEQVGTWHHSGILGLGVQTHSTLSSLLPSPSGRKFAIAMTKTGGALYLGAASSLGTPVFSEPVPTEFNDYAVVVGGLRLGPQSLLPAGDGTVCHVDSGASTLIFPKAAFGLFEALVAPLSSPPPSLFVNITGVGEFEIPLLQWDLASSGAGIAVTTDTATPRCAPSPRARSD